MDDPDQILERDRARRVETASVRPEEVEMSQQILGRSPRDRPPALTAPWSLVEISSSCAIIKGVVREDHRAKTAPTVPWNRGEQLHMEWIRRCAYSVLKMGRGLHARTIGLINDRLDALHRRVCS